MQKPKKIGGSMESKKAKITSVFLSNEELLEIEELFAEGDMQGIMDVIDRVVEDMREDMKNNVPDCENCDRTGGFYDEDEYDPQEWS